MSTNEEVKNQTSDFDFKGHGRCGGWRIPFFILGMILVKSAVAMILWNHLIPGLFNGPVLTYFQTVGLVILAKLLVGGGMRPGFGGPGHFGPPWARFGHMNHEQRLKLREELHKRRGWHSPEPKE